MMKAMMIAILLVLISGCSSNAVKPYASISVGHNLQEKAAPERYSNNCNMPAGMEVGVEHKSGLSAGLRHESNYDCGPYSPNPSTPEYWRDQVFVKYKFGGF